MNPLAALLSVGVVSAIPLTGVSLIRMRPASVRRMVLALVSFAVGAMLGAAFLHLLPEAMGRSGAGQRTALLTLLGFVVFFMLERWLTGTGGRRVPRVAALNLAGDALHNLLDGMVIVAGYAAGLTAGIATTLAVILHEIPQEIGDLGVLIYSGLPVRRAVLYNLLSALSAMLGAVTALVLGSRVAGFTDALLPLAAGAFIYVAASDLVPELRRQRGTVTVLVQVTLMLLGMLLMAVPGLLE
ncbi:MAG TPA: ZIP family metal transporter [Gemmatimonadales bacterium]|nr:ZIP family metal transporter [Gemmatimonadales bacterium]